jgi:hypothetical protein
MAMPMCLETTGYMISACLYEYFYLMLSINNLGQSIPFTFSPFTVGLYHNEKPNLQRV